MKAPAHAGAFDLSERGVVKWDWRRRPWSLDGRGWFSAYNCGMNAHCLVSEPDVQEWRRCLPFFLIAIALHAAVLLVPLKLATGALDVPPTGIVNVRLVEPPAAPAPIDPNSQPAPLRSSPKRERAVATVRPKLAMVPERAVAPGTFSVPEPTPVAAVPAAQIATTAPIAPAAPEASPNVVAARFDAAYLHNPRPEYPPLSRRLGEQGKVLLRVRVSREGLAAAVDIEKSSDFERLDLAAREVVSRWRFLPAKRGDEAIEAMVIVPIVFRLED